MSEIDQYKHTCLGIVTCPSTYEIVAGNNSHRIIPIYRIDEPGEEWNAKAGDLLLGGGSGESAAFRVSIPEAILLYTRTDWDHINKLDDEIYHAYWSMNQAFVFGEGFSKLGWQPNQPIENWLIEHILAFILREYPEIYSQYKGMDPLKQNGSICRLPVSGSNEESL